MLIGELCRRIGRSADSVKRWEEQGLLSPGRDARGRRIYSEADVEACAHLAHLAFIAQVRNTKLRNLVEPPSPQISFDFAPPTTSSAA
jgi:DNA-binding transcriptional MerR regulator